MSRHTAYPVIQLASDELHPGPWIFARQVQTPSWDPPPDGSLVEVQDRSGRFVGHALWNAASDIRMRWLSKGRRNALDRPLDFLKARLADADRLRRKILALPDRTQAYRIAHAEGDDLPGLIVDRIGDTLVCEHHARGFWNLRAMVAAALHELYPGFTVLHRVPRSARGPEGFEPEAGAEATAEEIEMREEGLIHVVRPGSGHKTGWFCDQRDNRTHIGSLARARSVLDLCCNQGGFALQAARNGAQRVVGVDLDEVVLDRAVRSAQRNGLDVAFEHADVFDFMRSLVRVSASKRPDLVILDPHKIVRGRAQIEAGRRKYGDLNTLALQSVRPGGLLATFSCSGALELSAFLGIVFGAARRAEREVRLLSTFQAAPDHPQRPDWPRSRYLKGALLAIDRKLGAARR